MAVVYNKTLDFFKKEIKDGQERPGILHSPYREEMPTFEEAGCEFVYPDLSYGS